jgi:hypothetical protein
MATKKSIKIAESIGRENGWLFVAPIQKIKRRKDNGIGHILRRNYFLKRFAEGKTDVMKRRGRKRKQLLDDLKQPRRL